MGKSDDNKIEKATSLPTALDYSKLPKSVLDAITTSQYEIDKASKLTWDGRQFIVRIPKEVAQEAEIKEGESIEFIIIKKFGATEKPEVRIRLVQNGKENGKE
jgi:hypothetical protein